MAETEKCWLCLRIKPSDIAKAVHKLPLINNKQAVHKIVVDCISLVKKAYEKNRAVFCSKTKLRIIGGLLYYIVNAKYFSYIDGSKRGKNYRKWFKTDLSLSRPHWITQREMAIYLRDLDPDKIDWDQVTAGEHTIRAGYNDWKNLVVINNA